MMRNALVMVSASSLAAVSFASLLLSSGIASAQDAHFGFVEEVRATEKGEFEFEQLATWKSYKNDEGKRVNRFEFREEFDYGLTDRLRLGVVLPEWHFTTGPKDDRDGPRWDAIGTELRYKISDPVKDAIGSAVLTEVSIGEDEFKLEGTGILQKNVGKWQFAYNLTLEAKWATDAAGERYSDAQGEIANRLAADYEFTPKWFVGGELVHEIPMPQWEATEKSNLFIGPDISSHHEGWAVTVAALWLVSGGPDEADVQVRTLFEFDF
jgi:hypothetical protein